MNFVALTKSQPFIHVGNQTLHLFCPILSDLSVPWQDHGFNHGMNLCIDGAVVLSLQETVECFDDNICVHFIKAQGSKQVLPAKGACPYHNLIV